MIGELDIEMLADKIYKRLAEGILRLPDEFKDNVRKGYMLVPVSVQMAGPAYNNYVIYMYVTNSGSLQFQIKDSDGRVIMERAFI